MSVVFNSGGHKPMPMKNDLIRAYIEIGSDRTEAMQIADLIEHAVNEAMDAVVRVAFAGGNRIGSMVIPVALQILSDRALGCAEHINETVLHSDPEIRTAKVVFD